MAKIGILGGTFNPIHNGHLALAQAACTQYGLDEVWLMPSKLPPHKERSKVLPEKERLYMTELAAKTNPSFRASDWELKRDGLTYTVDTMKELTEHYPEHHFYFIVGGDSAISFLQWREPARILTYTSLLVGGRAGYEKEEVTAAIQKINELAPEHVFFVELPDIRISSEEIRTAFESGQEEKVKDKLPESVYAYLLEKQFYRPLSLEALEQELQRILPAKRFRHTIGVAHLSAAYAVCHGANQEKAMLAGILHDCAKPYSDEELLVMCQEYNLPVTPVEARNGFLLHAKVGAYFAEHKYHVYDTEVLSAIRFHTTGRPEMTPYEKITFLADYLEPSRTQQTTPPLDEIRKMAFFEPDKAVCVVLENTIRYLKENGQEIDETTLKTFDYYNKLTGSYPEQ